MLQNRFGLLSITALGIAGVLLGRRISAPFNCDVVERRQAVSQKKNVPSMTPGWNYRPRQLNWRRAAVDRDGAETGQPPPSTPALLNETDNVSLEGLECAADPFIYREPTVEEGTAKALLWDREPLAMDKIFRPSALAN